MDPAANTRDRVGRARISSSRLHAHFTATKPMSTIILSSPTPPAPVTGGLLRMQQIMLENASIKFGPSTRVVQAPQPQFQVNFIYISLHYVH